MVEDIRNLAKHIDQRKYPDAKAYLEMVAGDAERFNILPPRIEENHSNASIPTSQVLLETNGQGVIIPPEETYSHPSFRFNFTQRELIRGEKLVPLTPIEASMLYLFTANPNKIIPKSILTKAIWKVESVSGNKTETYIGRLRRKIDALTTKDKFTNPIATVYRKGYILLDKSKPGYEAVDQYTAQRQVPEIDIFEK